MMADEEKKSAPAGMRLGDKEFVHKPKDPAPKEPDPDHQQFIESQFVQFKQANGKLCVLPINMIGLEERDDGPENAYLVWFAPADLAFAVTPETFEGIRGLLHAVRGTLAISDGTEESGQ